MAKITRLITQFSPQEVQHFFDIAKIALKNAYLILLYAPRVKIHGRILIITKRTIGNAVQRNKIRRHIKSIFYEEKFYEGNYDYALIVKKRGLTLSFIELKTILINAIKNIN